MKPQPVGAMIVQVTYDCGHVVTREVPLDRHLTDLAALFCADSVEIVRVKP